MAKTFLSALALLALASVAQAGPTNETRRDTVAGRQHDYWLSEGLNRLAFWQTPAHRSETRRQ